jgi:hypothetical protein
VRRTAWKVSLLGPGLVLVFLVTMATQCGSGARVATMETPTSAAQVPAGVATAAPDAPTQSPDIVINVGVLQRSMTSLMSMMADVQATAKTLSPGQQTSVTPQLKAYMAAMAKFSTDLQPALAALPASDRDKVAGLVGHIAQTSQIMLTAQSGVVPTSATGTTAGPGAADSIDQQWLAVSNTFAAIAAQLSHEQVPQLIAPIGDVTTQLNQLVTALLPTMMTLTPAQTNALALAAQDLASPVLEIVTGWTPATPTPPPSK